MTWRERHCGRGVPHCCWKAVGGVQMSGALVKQDAIELTRMLDDERAATATLR